MTVLRTIADEVTQHLTSFWVGTRQINLAELERYYYATQTPRDNGMFTTSQLDRQDVMRFFKPINYVAAVVDEPVGYLASGRFRVTSENPRAQAWAERYFNRRIRPRMDDLIRWQALYGEAFLYLWTDHEGISKGLKVDVLPPVEGGSRRVAADYGTQDAEELTQAVIYRQQPQDTTGKIDEYRVTLTTELIRVEKREAHTQHGTTRGWELISEHRNAINALPLIPFFNSTPSDILNMIQIQDDLDKLHLDLRLAREYYGQPFLTTDAHNIPDGLRVGPGRILFGGKYEMHNPPNLQSLMEERDALLEAGAKITKSLVLLSEMGNAPSGLALQYRQQSFQERLFSKAQRLEAGLELTLMTAARLCATDPVLFKYEQRGLKPGDVPSPADLEGADFSVALEPNIPADEQANAEIASKWLNELGTSRETALGKAGVEDPAGEIERAASEQEREMSYKPAEPGENRDP